MEPVDILENFRKLFISIAQFLLTVFPAVVIAIGAILLLFLGLIFFLLTGTSI